MPLIDPSTISEDELRPWIIDDEYEMKISESMSKFDETMTQTSLSRNWGSHTDSDLDKVRHDEIMQFAAKLEGDNDNINDEAGKEGADYMIVHDDDSVGTNGGVPHMLPFDESDEDDTETRDELVPLEEDEDILKLTSSLNNIDEERLKKTHTLRLLMQKEKKKREDDFRNGIRTLTHSQNLTKIPTAKYMPVHKTRVYQEWVDAQNNLRKEKMKSKAYLLDRPTTAFINTLIDQEREILTEAFTKKENDRLSMTENSSNQTSQAMQDDEHKAMKLRDFKEQKKCIERFNKLYPDLKINVPPSPISTDRSLQDRPATSGGPPIPPDSPRSPLRPLTADEKSKISFRKTKPTFDDKRCDMNIVLGLKDMHQSKFPSASSDTIPSITSPVLKFRTPREQVLDSLKVKSKAEDDEAKRKAALRAKEASKALQNLQLGNKGADRFSKSRRPATPLDKVSISASTGALKNNDMKKLVFLKPPKQKVKELRDLMKTTSGVDSRMFNKGLQTTIPYDSRAERQKTLVAAARTKEVDNTDSTTETLITPGFFEALGPQKIFLSHLNNTHKADEKFRRQLANRERSHITEADDLKKWAMDSISGGRKLFNSGGGGFHFS